MDEINNILAGNIAELRKRAGMTQSELAERLHYSDKLISKWERGDAAPNAAALWQMAGIFGVPVDELFTGPGGSGGPPRTENHPVDRKKRFLVASIAFCSVLLVVLLAFDITWILGKPFWRSFVYLLPAVLVTLLVLNSIWNRGKGNHLIIALLIPSVLLTVYVMLLPIQSWQIFTLLLPAEAIVFLSWLLGKRMGIEK